MTTITTRASKGSSLTFEEIDANFTNLKAAVDADEIRTQWKDRCALLDPAAFAIYTGAAFSFTVPAGEVWYLLNAWHVRTTGGGTTWYHRSLDVNRALMLPTGATVQSDGNASAFAYVCKPSLVTGGASYADPIDLYFTRLNTLRSLTPYEVAASISSGSAAGTSATTAFPTDFTNGLITHLSCMDVAWLILTNGSGNASNTFMEISDDHQQRIAEALLCPFLRTTFTSIQVRAASISGDAVQTSLAGAGVLRYYKLPAGW